MAKKKTPEASDRVRLSLDVPSKTKKELEELRKFTDARTLSEVMTKALKLYAKVSKEQQRGCTLFFREPSTEPGAPVREIMIL